MMQFLAELRRRNVFRVAAAYLVAGWLLIQIAALLESSLGLPDWFDAVAIGFLALCFPVALLLAWAFEMTPEGMKPTEALPEGASVAPQSAPFAEGEPTHPCCVVGTPCMATTWVGRRPPTTRQPPPWRRSRRAPEVVVPRASGSRGSLARTPERRRLTAHHT